MIKFDYSKLDIDIDLELLIEKVNIPKGKQNYQNNYQNFNLVLDIILQNYDTIDCNRDSIKMLHRYLHKSYGGEFKNSCNFIGYFENNESKIIFEPKIAVWEVPMVIDELCLEFKLSKLDPLLKIPMFLLDFILIHPFHKGNIEIMFLLNDLLFLKNYDANFDFSKKVYSNLEDFFKCIEKSSSGFNEGKFNYSYFIRYYLETLIGKF